MMVRLIHDYEIGQIEYVIEDDGIRIKNVCINQVVLKPRSAVIIIPEVIDEKLVVSIEVNSLNLIRKQRIGCVLLPYSVKQIGEKGRYLYEGFSEKGVFARPKLYYSFDHFEVNLGYYSVDERIKTQANHELIVFWTKEDDLKYGDVISLAEFLDDNWYVNLVEKDVFSCRYWKRTDERLFDWRKDNAEGEVIARLFQKSFENYDNTITEEDSKRIQEIEEWLEIYTPTHSAISGIDDEDYGKL